MSLHDDYARRTPWELVFPDDEGEVFADEVAQEAQGRGADPYVPASFLTMGTVARLARRLDGENAPDGALQRFGGLAFHGLHFARAGRPLYLASVHAVRYLVEGTPGGTPEPPTDAGYLQFPRHLFWSDPGSGAPESVDGLFWTATPDGLLHSMLVTGVRPDRPGMGVVPLPEAPLADAAAWLGIDARPDGTDFAADLPGAELDGLYGLATAGEVLKLLARTFAYMNGTPDAVAEHPAPDAPTAEPASDSSAPDHATSPDISDPGSTGSDAEDGQAGRTGAGPRPSGLPYRRITLTA